MESNPLKFSLIACAIISYQNILYFLLKVLNTCPCYWLLEFTLEYGVRGIQFNFFSPEGWIINVLPPFKNNFFPQICNITSIPSEDGTWAWVYSPFQFLIRWAFKISFPMNTLVIEWLGLHGSTAGDPSSIPGQGVREIRSWKR